MTFECTIGDSSLRSETMLVYHMTKVHELDCSFCDHCENIFTSREDLDEHILEDHTFQCVTLKVETKISW